jgi:hypothetical protein
VLNYYHLEIIFSLVLLPRPQPMRRAVPGALAGDGATMTTTGEDQAAVRRALAAAGSGGREDAREVAMAAQACMPRSRPCRLNMGRAGLVVLGPA